ncbi:MAG: hypothetical protein ACTSPG_10330, partial [Candidatus Hodarchaeales archaeon]
RPPSRIVYLPAIFLSCLPSFSDLPLLIGHMIKKVFHIRVKNISDSIEEPGKKQYPRGSLSLRGEISSCFFVSSFMMLK